MANFTSKTFQKYDDYATPKSAWEAIKHVIPKDKVIWEPFYCDGSSGTYLQELGFEVIHRPIDFFTHNEGDIIVSNPPFSTIKEILFRLITLQKPFILILPISKLTTQYLRKAIQGHEKELQLIIPKQRIQFIKMTVDGKPLSSEQKCNFDCCYYCFKMNLPDTITFL